MFSNTRYYIYLSKNKIDMLYGQLKRKGFKFPDISPKISGPGFEAVFDIKQEDKQNQIDIYTKSQQVLKTLERTKMVRALENRKPYIRYYNFDRGKWHSGIITEDIYSLPTKAISKSDERDKNVWGQDGINGAYINFKIHRNSLILLIGSSNHIIGSAGYHLDPSLQSPSTHFLLFAVPQFIKRYERADNLGKPQSAPVHISSSAGLCLSLSDICLRKFVEYPETELEILFIVYQKFDLRKAANEVIQRLETEDLEIMRNTKRWLKGKVSKTDMLKFRYLYVGSPIYTALQNGLTMRATDPPSGGG